MYHFFVGTKAQFVKMAPVMLEFESRGLPWRYIDSGQHAHRTSDLRATFGIREPDVVLTGRSSDVASFRDAAGWMLRLGWLCISRRRRVLADVFGGHGGVCLIHGDTLSTLFGLLLARRAGLGVAHVEAGLRSHNVMHPFPEELIRLWCMRRSHYLFCPSQDAMANLTAMRVRGHVLRLPGNTVVDSLRIAEAAGAEPAVEPPYALATCHRFETICSKRRLTAMLELLREVARTLPVAFVRHEPTRRAMERWRLDRLLADARVTTLPPQGYFDFIALQLGADAVFTDGGSIQEECYYTGTPCFIMRERTERPDGIGENAVLGGFDVARGRAFLAEREALVRGRVMTGSPSACIADALAGAGHGEPEESSQDMPEPGAAAAPAAGRRPG
jgi:UDP-N-acetylglucosamine 2-epimerase